MDFLTPSMRSFFTYRDFLAASFDSSPVLYAKLYTCLFELGREYALRLMMWFQVQ